MFRLLLATGLAALCLPSAALKAQTPPRAAPATPTSAAEVLTGVSPQTREDEIGDRRTYVSETRVQTPDGGISTNTQTFTLETLALTRNRLLMRYVLTAAEAQDAARPYVAQILGAYVDVPIEFEAGLNGAPLRIVNWTRVSETLTQNLARTLPDAEPIRSGTLAGLNAMSDADRAAAVLSDVALLAQMQPRGPVRQGRVEAPPEQVPVADGVQATRTRFAEMDRIDPATCTARIQSGWTLQGEDAPARLSESLTGELSTLDGWINTLESRSETTVQNQSLVRTVAIRRESPPGCG